MQVNAGNFGIISFAPHLICEIRKKVSNPIVALALLVFSSIGLLYVMLSRSSTKPIPTPLVKETIQKLTTINRNAILSQSSLTRVLFYGSHSEQEAEAKKMASELGLNFHYIDARKLREIEYRKKTDWPELLRRIAYSKKPEFVFISHADELYQTSPANCQIPTILFFTGSLSKTLLLCLGFSSLNNVDPEISSRYPQKIYLPPSS